MQGQYRHHPHVPHPDHLNPQKTKPSRFETAFVTRHAKVLGSAKFAYFCYVLDLIMFLALVQQTYQQLSGPITLIKIEALITLWVVFLAQTYIQLVALPVLQNFQNRQSAADDAKKAADHQALTYVATSQDRVRDLLDPATEGGIQILLAAIDSIPGKIAASITRPSSN